MADTQHDSEAPAKGQQVIVAAAFIHRELDGRPQLFLARRSPTKKFYPGVYELPGGHVDFGEDIVAALRREIREELQADIEVGDPFSVITYMNEVKGAHTVEVCYFARFKDESQVRLNPDDHDAANWFFEEQSEEYLTNRTQDDDQIAVLQHGFALLKGRKLQV